MAYKHGVYIQEEPTSLLPPVNVGAGLPVVFGTAPIHMTENPSEAVNKPILCYTYKEAVQKLGFSTDFESFTLCEFMRSHFALFNVAPVVFVNVLDPSEHQATVSGEDVTLVAGKAALAQAGALLDTIVVKDDGGSTEYEPEEDYLIQYNDQGKAVILRLEGGAIPSDTATLKVDYTHLDAAAVQASDVLGGINPATGNATGLELLDEVFPRFRQVPGQVLAPKFSTDPAVAAVMTGKASNINEHFKAISLVDIDTTQVENYTDAPAFKNDNNLTSEFQAVCWPKVQLGDEQFHLSTQLAGLICKVDSQNDDVPHVSPSNKNIQATAAVTASGDEVWLGPNQAAMLNGEGIITALNFQGGWVGFGNRTGAYPANTDPKDAFLALRRMFNWIGNTLTLTFWQRVDAPLNRRQIDTVLDSANIWLNGLAARQFILGGRVEFLETENPDTDLMDGIARFHVYITPPSPNREIDFILEYDPAYLQTLFG